MIGAGCFVVFYCLFGGLFRVCLWVSLLRVYFGRVFRFVGKCGAWEVLWGGVEGLAACIHWGLMLDLKLGVA